MGQSANALAMKSLRDRRKADDLVEVKCHIRKPDKARLAHYVTQTLKGECNVRVGK